MSILVSGVVELVAGFFGFKSLSFFLTQFLWIVIPSNN